MKLGGNRPPGDNPPIGVPGGGGGNGPRAQALEGAPAQLVGPNCKKKIRPRQISKVTSLQWRMQDLPNGGGGGGAHPTLVDPPLKQR